MDHVHNKRTAIIAISVSCICLLLYLRSLSCDFVNWDDPSYIVENTGIRIFDWQFIVEAFTTSYMGWWMPLTWISLAIDYHFWNLNPFGYHLTNVVLHSANCGLLVLIADKLYRAYYSKCRSDDCSVQMFAADGSRSGALRAYPAMLLLAGLIWGIHPLRVESVAWVTERKDVLNGLFSLGSILCYLIHVQKKERWQVGQADKPTEYRYYLFSLLFLFLSIMSKPVSVVLPAMLLVMDWFPLKRLQAGKLRGVLLEKAPFLAVAALMAFATIYFASSEKLLVSYSDLSFYSRCLLAGNALFEYVRLSIYPVKLVHLYLFPWPFPSTYTIKTVVTVIFTCFCLGNYRKYPWLVAMWLCFILPLIPVLGFFQNGSQSHAARFTYLPAVIPSICGAAVIVILVSMVANRSLRIVFVGLIAALIIGYGGMTERLIATWDNGGTLWSRLISINPIGRAYFLRAQYSLQVNKYPAAADDLRIAITMANSAGFPEVFNLHALRGHALYKLGRFDEAIHELTTAIGKYPSPNYYYHRGLAKKALGLLKDADDDFARAGSNVGPITWQNL